MLRYIIGRIGYSLLVLWGIVTVIFLIFNIERLNPASSMLGQRQDQSLIDAINKDIGWDLPKWKRYIKYLDDLSIISVYENGDHEHYLYFDREKYKYAAQLFTISSKVLVIKPPYLRRSYQSKRLVTDIIGTALPVTAVLALLSIFIATVLGIGLGMISAVYKNTWLDKLSLVTSIFGMSLPSFVAAILMVWVFAYLLGNITGLPVTGSLYEVDEFEGRRIVWRNLILPAITLGIRPLAIVMQLTRSSMLEVLSMDYMRTARAKGLSFNTIIIKHGLINALNPVVTAISGWLASLMAGAVFVEIVFGWNGIGNVLLEALNTSDLPVVMGAVLVVSIIFVAINVLVDIIYGIIDPRVRLG